MSFLDGIKDVLTKENISTIADIAKTTLAKVSHKQEDVDEEDVELEEVSETVSEEEQEEQGSKMVQVMDWAFDKANGNIPGFGTSHEMAQKYLEKYGSVTAAIDHLVNWQITTAATTGFVTNLGGLPLMPLTLPANIAGVMAIQLRMIGAIAELGGYTDNTEEKKTGMYLCLLGSQAGDVLSKTATQFAVKFATASLKKMPAAVLTKINQAVGFRLVTKFGEKGLINLHKAIPVLGGIVGGAVDALSTYAIAKAAKAMFLDEIIDFEKQEQIEIMRMRLTINMALVDGEYSDMEREFLKGVAVGLSLSDKSREMILAEIERPRRQKIDLTPFKEDIMNSASLLAGLSQLAKADGVLHPAEKIYLTSLGHELGYSDETLKEIL